MPAVSDIIRRFEIKTEASGVKTEIIPVSDENGITVYRFTADRAEKTVPSSIEVCWEEPMEDLLHVWTPLGGWDHAMRQWFGRTENRACFYCGAPVLCIIGPDDENRETIAISDGDTHTSLTHCILDLPQRFTVQYSAVFFAGDCDPVEHYEALIRIDSRHIPYYKAIGEVNSFWEKAGFVHPDCPENAELPLYSSWYNFHQAPNSDKLLTELELAKDIGFRTFILDDGWQFEGPTLGDYSLCGVWKMSPDKFSDFAGFTRRVHEFGIKVIVWFSVPFIGINSPLYKQFEGKYLYKRDWPLNAAVLDPRYPDVRRFLTGTYARFLREYDIDGFKLDFIDSFAPGELTAPFGGEMDVVTIQDGVKRLLDEIRDELGSIKPDLMFEYRQPYIGPSITRYGNMLRVGDCAYEAMANRIGIVSLRLLNYPLAVHADMLYWAPSENPENCARQLINILFGVPQISVILEDSTPQQLRALQHYIGYWNENRDTILHGEFFAEHPENQYTRVGSRKNGKAIIALYTPQSFTWCGESCDIFNGCDQPFILLDNPSEDDITAECFDLYGNLCETAVIPAESIRKQAVGIGGMIRLYQSGNNG